jgi:hypothetical protein
MKLCTGMQKDKLCMLREFMELVELVLLLIIKAFFFAEKYYCPGADVNI